MTIYYTLADLSDGGKAHGGVAYSTQAINK